MGRKLGKQTALVIASGKGGVGKSTASVASALMFSEYKKVGLLDLDIRMPNIDRYLNMVDKKVELEYDIMQTPIKYNENLSFFTIGSIVPKGTAIIWDDKKIEYYIVQCFISVAWQNPDYFVIDTPPASNVELLTLKQIFKKLSVILVTTEDPMSLDDCARLIELCKKFKIKITGVVENFNPMESDCCRAEVVCKKCGKKQSLFNSYGVKRFAEDNKIEYLGNIPFNCGLSKNKERFKMHTTYPVFENIRKKVNRGLLSRLFG